MPALITPFNADERIDVRAHLHNVSTAESAGASGILIAGSTGEGPYLEPGEREILVSGARESSSDLTILCGISAETDRQAASQINEAAAGGADAVLVVTPGTLIRGKATHITAFYTRVADLSPLPVFLYTVPAVTGYELPVESVHELAGHRNVYGMKDSGGDFTRLEELKDALTSDFIVYAGKSMALHDSHARGAFGAITASANYAFSTVHDAVSGDAVAQSELTAITGVVERYGVPGTKFAASLAGMDPGHSRLPLLPLEENAEREIRHIKSPSR
jgi:4-hydroxy-2-oxoglutarate aldolase